MYTSPGQKGQMYIGAAPWCVSLDSVNQQLQSKVISGKAAFHVTMSR